MFCFSLRRKGRKVDPPKPPGPEATGCGIFRGLHAPKDSLGAAVFRWPAGMNVGKLSMFFQHRRPGKGWKLWNRDRIRTSRGAGEIWRDGGMPGEAGDDPSCVQADGTEPRTSRNGRVQQEKLKVENTPGRIQRLGEDVRDEPVVPCRARNGNVPRCAEGDGKVPELLEKLGTCRNAGGGQSQQGKLKVENAPGRIQHLQEDTRDEPVVLRGARNGNVPREGTDQPQPPLQARSGEDEEGQSGGPSQSPESHGQGDTDAAAAAPGGDGDRAERRRGLWERLRRLEADMEGLEGESTAALAARLAQLILEKPTPSYPAEPGILNVRRERGSGAGQDLELGVPDVSVPRNMAGNDGSFLGSGNAESGEDSEQEEEDEDIFPMHLRQIQLELEIPSVHPEQGSGASQNLELGVPDVSIHGGAAGNDGIFVGMLQLSGNADSREDSEQEEEEEDIFPMHLRRIQLELEIPSIRPEQDLELGVPNVSIHGNMARNDRICVGMLQVGGNAGSREDSDDSDEDIHPFIRQAQLSMTLREEFPEAWARHSLDCGRLAEEELLDGPPVWFPEKRPRRWHVEEKMAKLLEQYLQEGIVEEGRSSSNNRLISIPKSKGRGWRLGLHCPELNKTTFMGPPERLDSAAIAASIWPESHFFSVLDLCSASLAIPLARTSQPRFAFTFRGRQFRFTRLPPGFHGTSSILHRRVAAMLAQLEPRDSLSVFHYYDDILITGESPRQTEHRTRRVLQLIQSTGFKVQPAKAQLVQPEVNYLGMTIGATGRRIPVEKVDEICEECDDPGPWNAARLRSILGKFKHWENFIPNYCELALPLQRLTGKREWEWEWGRQQRRQLRQLKEALEHAPVLPFADRFSPFVIRISLHTATAGAVLLQENAGVLRPLGHCSHSLRRQTRPRRQSAARRDVGCLEAVRAVQAFQALIGLAPIVIHDPNGNYLIRGQPFGPGRSWPLDQWTLLLTTKQPQEHRSQYPMMVILEAPWLQQLPSHIPGANVWFLAVEKGSSQGSLFGFAATNLEEKWLLGVSRGNSEAETELEALQRLLEQHQSCSPLYLYSNRPSLKERLRMREKEQGGGCSAAWACVQRWLYAFPGKLYIREVRMAGGRDTAERAWIGTAMARARAMVGKVHSGWTIWEPSKYEKQEIIAQCHLQHKGVEETLARVRKVGTWESDRADVERWVRSCPRCRETDPHDPDPDPAPQRAEGPWSCLQISLSKDLPATPEGFHALLVVQDRFSGWVDAFPLWQGTEREVTRVLLQEVFGRFGKVSSVLLAPGPTWMWDSLSQAPLWDFWSRLERSEPHEAATCLLGVAQAVGKDWAEMLPLILAGIRSFWVNKARLGPLLSIPGLPLELRGELPGDQDGLSQENELSWLEGMEVLEPGYRTRLECMLQ